MRENFKLSKNVLTVIFKNVEGQKAELNYRLYDHPPARKFLSLASQTVELRMPIQQDGVFFGNALNDRETLIRLLDSQIEFHNDYCISKDYQNFLFPFKTDNPLTQDRLSRLHEYFEKSADHEYFSSYEPARSNLLSINLNIHLLESCLDPNSSNSHIEVLPNDPIRVPLEDEDYPWFSPDNVWGELTLTYGITGVPTLNSLYSKSKPTPQDSISNGVFLSFFENYNFNQHQELKEWLSTFGLDSQDPKSSVGYIPLGILEDIDTIDRKKVLDLISKHRHVEKYLVANKIEPIISLGTSASIARWPFDPEIFYHLDLCPYIDLGIEFDALPLFQEAYRARDYFVTHREYDQSSKELQGKWKSLALQGLNGDYSKTMYHTSYGISENATYLKTVFAELCPETMSFLETITDLDQCQRVRFMMLEPGASIKVHRDNHVNDVSMAINISLNMPEGCSFFAGLEANGEENLHSVKVPFKNSGSVILFNNAKYHKVENNSDVPRIHIIFHGPIKFTDQKLIEFARAQNQIHSRKELLAKLIQKKAAVGEDFNKTPTLLSDWLSSGLSKDTLPSNFSLCVYGHSHSVNIDYLRKRTFPTLFPLDIRVIEENSWDDYLEECFSAGKEFAVLMAAGTFVLHINKFIEHLVQDCRRLKESQAVFMGHIMDFNNGVQLPYFHEQFLIVNLKSWGKIGKIKLGPLFSVDRTLISNIRASSEHIHDDYTPIYLEQGNEEREGTVGWGSLGIKKCLELDLKVLNLSEPLRSSKVYAYPRDSNVEAQAKIESIVQEKLNFSSNEVYFFNNEPLHVLRVKDFRPTKLISVAAGFKAFQILKQYSNSGVSSCHFVDFSRPALNYIQGIIGQSDFESLSTYVKKAIDQDPLKKYDSKIADSLIQNTVRESFDGSNDELMNSIKIAKNSTFEFGNIVMDPQSITKHLIPKESFVIWVSNAFYNNQLYYLLTPEEADMRFLELVKAISTKTDLRAFRFKDSQTVVFGKGIDFIRGILTDGAPKDLPFDNEFWNEIKA